LEKVREIKDMLETKIISLIYSALSLAGLAYGLYKVRFKKDTYGEAGLFFLIGAFVWADAVVLGTFGLLMGITAYFSGPIFLGLILSVFWTVRSGGEVVYWLNQQFSGKEGNSPDKFIIYKFFKDDSVWFINQVLWQCVMVVSIISSIYFIKLYLFELLPA
jgi:hypothetical protein